MTAVETLEYAQTSVDQIERGLGFVQDQLDRAEDLALKVDEMSAVASDVVVKARRLSRILFILGGLLTIGGVVTVIVVRKRRKAIEPEDVSEPAT